MQSTSILWTGVFVPGCTKSSCGLRVSRHARFFSAGALRGPGAARSLTPSLVYTKAAHAQPDDSGRSTPTSTI